MSRWPAGGPPPEPGMLLAIRTPDGQVLHHIITGVVEQPDGWTDIEAIPDPFGPQWPDPNRPGRPAQP